MLESLYVFVIHFTFTNIIRNVLKIESSKAHVISNVIERNRKGIENNRKALIQHIKLHSIRYPPKRTIIMRNNTQTKKKLPYFILRRNTIFSLYLTLANRCIVVFPLFHSTKAKTLNKNGLGAFLPDLYAQSNMLQYSFTSQVLNKKLILKPEARVFFFVNNIC